MITGAHMTSTTMTIRVPVEVHDKLSRLAQGIKRSRSYVAAEAVAAYVERELSIIEGVQLGLADVAAGRTVAHDVAMDQVDAAVAKVRSRNG
jgi:predicted transcriptional regulator